MNMKNIEKNGKQNIKHCIEIFFKVIMNNFEYYIKKIIK